MEIRTLEAALPAPQGRAQPAALGSLGSGVMISPEGKILTAAHVVQTADQIEVLFVSGERVPAHVVSSEPLVWFSAPSTPNCSAGCGPPFW